jgi:hypothetical protein
MLSKIASAIGALFIVALSFSATLYALDRWAGGPDADPIFTASIRPVAPAAATSPAPVDVGQETAIDALPKTNNANFRWVEIDHLYARSESGASPVGGQPIIRLTATRQDGAHLLVGQFSGLNRNRVYRVTAWIKSEGRGNLLFETSDHGTAQQAHYAQALFDLSERKVVRGNGAAETRGIDQGPDGWEKAWLDLTTSDGQIVVAFRPANGAETSYAGDGQLGLILGGIQVDPRG